MITFFTLANNTKTLRMYFQDWGGPLTSQIRILCYEDAIEAASLLPGTYIFCDTDLMADEEMEVARALYQSLKARGDKYRILNQPGQSSRRYELLRTLHENGINNFNVYRPDDDWNSIRFPVFVRHERLHKGSFTEVLPDRDALQSALSQLEQRFERRELLIVEFVDVSQDGLFRKYGAVRVGDVLVPHHVLFDKKWHIKLSMFSENWMLEEEREFQNENPHCGQLMKIFRLANIEYGRIDYALYEGRLQVWEINTNPTLLYPRADYKEPMLPAKIWFAQHLNAAFKTIDDKTPKAWSLGAQF